MKPHVITRAEAVLLWETHFLADFLEPDRNVLTGGTLVDVLTWAIHGGRPPQLKSRDYDLLSTDADRLHRLLQRVGTVAPTPPSKKDRAYSPTSLMNRTVDVISIAPYDETIEDSVNRFDMTCLHLWWDGRHLHFGALFDACDFAVKVTTGLRSLRPGRITKYRDHRGFTVQELFPTIPRDLEYLVPDVFCFGHCGEPDYETWQRATGWQPDPEEHAAEEARLAGRPF